MTNLTHDTDVQRVGPGAYRAACAVDGWQGDLRSGVGRWAKRSAEADADVHAGRVPEVTGSTPMRPSRIPDRLWLPVVQIADEEGTSASAVLREALERDPRVAAILAGESALASN